MIEKYSNILNFRTEFLNIREREREREIMVRTKKLRKI